jgi:hypothetical protein
VDISGNFPGVFRLENPGVAHPDDLRRVPQVMKGYGQDTAKIRTLRNKVRYLSILQAERTRIPRTTDSRPCSSTLLIHQDFVRACRASRCSMYQFCPYPVRTRLRANLREYLEERRRQEEQVRDQASVPVSPPERRERAWYARPRVLVAIAAGVLVSAIVIWFVFGRP